MQVRLLLLLLLCALVAWAEEEEEDAEFQLGSDVDFTPQARKDFIKRLPGLKLKDHRRMFSGYIPVEGQGRSLFYWLLESDLGFANAPVM
ncbi:hypothetical protein BASA81_012405 [Batrachochytrium salamandrivorans]|nr:hypothetical protein BASA81_012405 [Batrachochytrium salamandrivorans]